MQPETRANDARIAADHDKMGTLRAQGCSAAPPKGSSPGGLILLQLMPPLIFKRLKVSRPSGQWRNDDYDVICKGAVVGRLFLSAGGPQDRQWMWIQHRTPAHGYEPSREAAMAAFARSWRRS
jgi:hypothetical protein